MNVRTVCLITIIGLLPSSVFAMSCPMNMTMNTIESVNEWRSVNDGVMGGRSSGSVKFSESHMVFAGVINTNGGGFSSIRRFLPPEALSKSRALKLRIKSDGREYKVTLRTDAKYGQRQVSFQAPLPVTQAGVWDEVVVPLENLKGTVFGRPIQGAKFDSSKVRSLGIIIADGHDGPFRLELEEIAACHD